MTRKQLLRLARSQGWDVQMTRGGHYRLTHPNAATPIMTASTPRHREGCKRDLARMRRMLALGKAEGARHEP